MKSSLIYMHSNLVQVNFNLSQKIYNFLKGYYYIVNKLSPSTTMQFQYFPEKNSCTCTT